MMGCNYNDLSSIGALPRDNVRMENVRILSPGKNGFDPGPRGAPHRSNERVHHPSAICMIGARFNQQR